MKAIENLNKADKDNVQRSLSHFFFFGGGGVDLTKNKAMGPAGRRLSDLSFE